MSPEHGDHRPGLGWYSAKTKHWHDSPTKIGLYSAPPPPDAAQRAEFERSWTARKFKPDATMEGLLRLRDSAKQEDREQYAKLAAGRTRITLAGYEAERRAFLAGGGKLE